MSEDTPLFRGRASIRHGFARSPEETPSGLTFRMDWGSPHLRLPSGVRQTIVRLQAEDGGNSAGILYARGNEKTVVVVNHPRADFSSHYIIPSLLASGFAAFGGMPRFLGNDRECIHEYLIADLGAQVAYLRRAGFEHVILLGNSGGGSLSAFYQAQAVTAPPGRLTDTPAGDPYDLNALSLSPADAVVFLAAHVGEGAFLLDNLDPSVTDENDPLSCDPDLDMYNPANGYRPPPEASKYSEEFLVSYRAAQRARCARLDAIARQDIDRRRRYRRRLESPDFASWPADEQNHVTRMAHASRFLTVHRTAANPWYTDLSIEPSTRVISTLLGPDPQTVNYTLGGFAAVMTPEGWLSTWSGLSSRANLLRNITAIEQPTLVVSFLADAGIPPADAERVVALSPAADKSYASVDASHYGLSRDEPRHRTVLEAGEIITSWLRERYAA